MPIWRHEHLARPFDEGFTAHVLERRTCLYCKTLLTEVEAIPSTLDWRPVRTRGRCCPMCGWWYVEEILEKSHDHSYGGFARLRNLDLNDVSLPVEEVRQYLLAKFDSRFRVHPRMFEQTVATVFRDVGYAARLTAYGGDNGIDVFLDGPDGTLVGIQVKRWRGSVKIEQIHALAGALIVNGCTEGVFVTTSSFQRGAKRTADVFRTEVGIPIQLIDSSRLYAALQIAATSDIPKGSDPDAPWNRIARPELWID